MNEHSYRQGKKGDADGYPDGRGTSESSDFADEFADELRYTSAETAFAASEETPGQDAARSAWRAFEDAARGMEWWEDYVELRAMRLPFRMAGYVAWKASPAVDRRPATQEELASLLGLRSDRAIRRWVEKRPELKQLVELFQLAPLMAHRRDVVKSLIESATNADAAHSADRRLFFQLTRDLGERSQQRHVGAENEPAIRVYIPDNGRGDRDPATGGAAD